MLTRDEMLFELQQGPCEVKFTKLSGEERTMQCTLDENIIPGFDKYEPMSSKKMRAINEQNIVVWDLKVEDWRTFRVDSVKEFK